MSARITARFTMYRFMMIHNVQIYLEHVSYLFQGSWGLTLYVEHFRDCDTCQCKGILQRCTFTFPQEATFGLQFRPDLVWADSGLLPLLPLFHRFALLECCKPIAAHAHGSLRVLLLTHCHRKVLLLCYSIADTSLNWYCHVSNLLEVMSHLLLFLKLLWEHHNFIVSLLLDAHWMLDRFVCFWLLLRPCFVEIAEAVLNTFFIHWHSLLKHVQGTGNDIKLWNHLFES